MIADGESPQLQYSLDRLTKGLYSQREGAKQGFSLALTEVLSTFPHIGILDVYEDIVEKGSFVEVNN